MAVSARHIFAVATLGSAMLFALPVAGAQSPPAGPRAVATPSGGGLRPGDVVRLQIWREPDLSGEFIVDETGVVILPKIGPMNVTGTPPDSMKAAVVHAYEAYLNQPSITVALLRRVQVIGAVRNPGLYKVDPTMTVSDALALAGGATTRGNLKKVELIRDGRKLPGTVSHHDVIAATALRSGDQLNVPERNFVSRNPWIITWLVSTTLSLILAFNR